MKCQINIKKVAFGNKERTTDKKMGVLSLLRLFISINEVCNTAKACFLGKIRKKCHFAEFARRVIKVIE